MKVSTRGRYALRIMVDLALSPNGENIKVKDMAKRQDISEKYLEQIVGILNKGGLVRASRGAQGGYQLAMDPNEISVGRVLRLTEGSLSPVSCVEKGDCEKKDTCATYGLWKEWSEAVSNIVDKKTIGDLAEGARARGTDNYVI
ncbi:MAG: Rrf2 family transcriptional regulator [Lachnospiraceae bacterium]|nr:Rrf2 family transcriptional regulator [Lachnospiraceae bacterium]